MGQYTDTRPATQGAVEEMPARKDSYLTDLPPTITRTSPPRVIVPMKGPLVFLRSLSIRGKPFKKIPAISLPLQFPLVKANTRTPLISRAVRSIVQ